MSCLLMTQIYLFISDENIGELFQQINNELKSVSKRLKSISCLQNFQNYSLMA